MLTLVSILHFDVGMLTTDPYDAALDDIGAPNRTWTVSVIVLILLSYSGDAWERLASALGASSRRAPRGSGPRGDRERVARIPRCRSRPRTGLDWTGLDADERR